MAFCFIPPVDSRNLFHMKMSSNSCKKQTCSFTIFIQRIYFCCQFHFVTKEYFVGFIQDIITMGQQLVGIPCQEKNAFLGLISSTWFEKFCRFRYIVRFSSIIWQLPLRMAYLCCSLFEISFKIFVIALQDFIQISLNRMTCYYWCT